MTDARAPRISVIVPAFNAEPWVGDTLRSVLDQIPPVHEVIVVDDGSRDRTAEVASTFAGVLVLTQDHAGASAARNAGARRATGDALLFLDADDALQPTAIAALLDAAGSHPGWSALVPNYVREGAATGFGWDPGAGDRIFGRRELAALVRGERVSMNALVRTEAWTRNPFREDLRRAEDLDFWLRLVLGGGRIVRLAAPVIRVRVDRPPGSPSNLRSKRGGRRRVFGDLLRRSDLTPSERLLAFVRLLRASAGVLLAPREGRGFAIDVLHVHLDDTGGGPAHVDVLMQALRPDAEGRRVALPPTALRASPLGWLGAWRTLARATRERPTLVHAHGVRAAAAGFPVAMARRRPLVVTAHGLHSLRRSPGGLSQWANRLVLSRAAVVLVLSDSDRELIQRGRLARRERVRQIRAGVQRRAPIPRDEARRRLGLPETGFVALWLGRLAPEKDPATFVRTVAGIGGECGVVGAIAGDGPLRAEVEALVGSSAGHVRSLGWVDDPWVAICAADVFVGTSMWEGRSMAALEAALAGRPLVLVDRPGSRDLVHEGVPAVLVPAGDDAALGRAIVALAASPEHRASLGERTALAATGFGPTGLAEDVLEAYRSVLRSR